MGEPVSLLGFFVSAASTFGKLIGWLRSADRDGRERVATYFDRIASCMREVAERIESGDPPRDTCRRLAVYADELQGILGKNGHLIAAGDASIEETRVRLSSEIRKTQNFWSTRDQEMREPRVLSATAAASGIVERVMAASDNHSYPRQSGPEVDRLTSELLSEFVDRHDVQAGVQAIWDASGEFAALADALRAR